MLSRAAGGSREEISEGREGRAQAAARETRGAVSPIHSPAVSVSGLLNRQEDPTPTAGCCYWTSDKQTNR